MKFERLLKVPRSSRTIQLVINIPEATAAVAPPLKPTGWAGILAVLKVVGPSVVAVAAIIISILSLQNQGIATSEQQRTDAAATAAKHRAEAQQVSFLQVPISKTPYNLLQVENYSVSPVYDVTFQVNAFSARSVKGAFVARTLTLWLGNIPACSSSIINMFSAAMAGMHKITGLSLQLLQARIFAVQVNSMSFADGNGNDWQYSGGYGESLQRMTDLPGSTFAPSGYMRAKYKAVSSCS